MTQPSHVVSATNGANSSATVTTSITTQTQTNSVLFAWVCIREDATDDDVNSVVFDPGGGAEANFTNSNLRVSTFGAGYNIIELWYLIDPPVGTYNVTSTTSQASQRHVLGLSQYKDVDQTDPIGESGTGSGNGVTSSVDVTTATANSMVIAANCDDRGTDLAAGSGDTERWERLQSGVTGWGGETPATTTGTYTVSCSDGSTSDYWVMLGAEILEAAAGGDLSISKSDSVTVADSATMGALSIGIPVTKDNTDYQYTGVKVVDG